MCVCVWGGVGGLMHSALNPSLQVFHKESFHWKSNFIIIKISLEKRCIYGNTRKFNANHKVKLQQSRKFTKTNPEAAIGCVL